MSLIIFKVWVRNLIFVAVVFLAVLEVGVTAVAGLNDFPAESFVVREEYGFRTTFFTGDVFGFSRSAGAEKTTIKGLFIYSSKALLMVRMRLGNTGFWPRGVYLRGVKLADSAYVVLIYICFRCGGLRVTCSYCCCRSWP